MDYYNLNDIDLTSVERKLRKPNEHNVDNARMIVRDNNRRILSDIVNVLTKPRINNTLSERSLANPAFKVTVGSTK